MSQTKGKPADAGSNASASATSADPAPTTVRARVICDGDAGKVNEIVENDPALIASWKAAGLVDDHPDAVAYAERLNAGDSE